MYGNLKALVQGVPKKVWITASIASSNSHFFFGHLVVIYKKGQIMDRPVHYIISNVIGNVISKLVPTMYIILDEIR